ncbi:hypothetical protein SLS58_009313 [Diplodia intermedia]|uniref:Clock-controlled protein 6 n=1 Tax=Diplodia intermedia TaxID=856260 RepID=A0ABR3TD00_9PEZI
MRFSAVAAAAALAAGAQAAGNSTGDVYVTEVVSEYTTYCPYATSFTQAGKTYTVSSATTLTITDCAGGCTVTKQVAGTPYAATPHPTTPSANKMPVISSSSSAPYPTGGNSTNGTISISKPVLSTTAGASASASGAAGASASSTQTGAANHIAASGAGLAALLGFAAYVL